MLKIHLHTSNGTICARQGARLSRTGAGPYSALVTTQNSDVTCSFCLEKMERRGLWLTGDQQKMVAKRFIPSTPMAEDDSEVFDLTDEMEQETEE